VLYLSIYVRAIYNFDILIYLHAFKLKACHGTLCYLKEHAAFLGSPSYRKGNTMNLLSPFVLEILIFLNLSLWKGKEYLGFSRF